MVRIIAKNFIKPDSIEKAKPLFRELVAASRKDAGCLEYRLHYDDKELGSLFLSKNGPIKGPLTNTTTRNTLSGSFPKSGRFVPNRVRRLFSTPNSN
jgi:hypothetical protein